MVLPPQEVLEARIVELEDALARLYDKFNQVSVFFSHFSFLYSYFYIIIIISIDLNNLWSVI